MLTAMQTMHSSMTLLFLVVVCSTGLKVCGPALVIRVATRAFAFHEVVVRKCRHTLVVEHVSQRDTSREASALVLIVPITCSVLLPLVLST